MIYQIKKATKGGAMKKALKKGLALTMAAAVVLATAGCSGNTGGNVQTAEGAKTSADTSAVEQTGAEEQKLSIWGQASVWLPANETEIGKSPFLMALQEQTGVTLDLTAVSGDAKQQFNLMIAGGKENLPDIIDNVDFFEGGAPAAYEKGYLIELNDLIDQYAPNYKKYLEEHPEIDKMVKTDDGKYLTFPMVRGQDELCCFNGLVIRKDWLDQAGLEVPTTMEEWYQVLTVFKNEFGATAPFVLDAKNHWHYNNFAQAYGAMYDYFQKDGKVVFGPTEPGFKDFLAEMNRWYEEGLIDPNYLTSDSKAREAAITTGQAGALWGAVGGGIGKFMEAMAATEPEFELVGALSPTLKEGDTPILGYKSDYAGVAGMGITSNCKNPELAVKFLDYGYSKEGNDLYNFGIEGVSYQMVDGKPVYTDVITKNPDGLTISQAMSYYIGASHMNGGFVQSIDYYNQYLARPQQREAVVTWSMTEAEKYLLPPISLTSEESAECGSIDTDIWTLVDENVASFITGERPIDEFDAYVEEVNSLDINRALEIRQAALERFAAK